MSSAICQNFVQNAWKKELCSNCFKSKDEHLKRAARASKPIQAPPIILNSTKTSIIRTTNKIQKPKRNVNFRKELTQVIGYGGEDWSSDQEEDEEEDSTDTNEADDECLSSEDNERELQRLTKANTDFNANSLNISSETKKSYAQLKLGKPQYDSDGKKQSLVISVTPFGEQKKTSSILNNKSHIPIISKAKDPIMENKNNIVLTSYTSKSSELKEEKSLLEEITETLEKSKNPIQIITRKKTQKDIVLAIPEKNAMNIEEPKLVKSTIPERKNGLSRNVVIKRDEKPIVYQSSVGKIELSTKKTIYSKVKEDNTDDSNTSSSDDASIDGEKTRVSEFSREQVGEPDGKADSDNSNELPSLPLTPPPVLDQPAISPEKPKIPNKPATILIRKNPHQFGQPNQEPSNVLTSFMSEVKATCQLVKRDSNGSDIAQKSGGNFFLNNNKRKAPKPPHSSEDIGIYTKNNINVSIISDCPVVREKEKRERASSCSPKFRNDGTDSVSVCDDPHGENSSIGSDALDSSIPAPAPRRSLSLSTDSLANGEVKKDKNRPRFSLKKFLRISSGKELSKPHLDIYRSEQDLRPQPKPRLEIVHPLDLNGRSVEVLNKDHQQDNKVTEVYLPRIQIIAKPVLTSINPVVNNSNNSVNNNKPSPPPRANQLLNEDVHKPPVLPHPPKSAQILTKQRQVQLNNMKNIKVRPKTDSVYANIGEVRSCIAPNKPQRTASMRDGENQSPLLKPNTSSNSKDNVYEYVISGNTTIGSNRSSSPEAESSSSSASSGGGQSQLQVQLRSEGTAGEYYKGSTYAQQMPRSVSLTYCGSETESEIYAPYSYYGSESEIAEDENDWNNSTGRTHKLRSRKGRSIVHRNLEDNYGAVVVANHEALAQVLENIQHNNNTFIPPHLRPLKSSPTLRFTDFSLTSIPIATSNASPLSSLPIITVGRYTFRPATYNIQPVTLSIISSVGGGPARGGSGGTLLTTSMLAATGMAMSAVVEFNDVVPREEVVIIGGDKDLEGVDGLRELEDEDKESMVQATIAVLPLLQLTTIQSYGVQQQSKPITSNPSVAVGRLDGISKDAVFVLLQLVNALKTLQAQGIEELPLSLDTFVLAKDADRDVYYRLYVLQGSSTDDLSTSTMITYGSLCSCAASALSMLRPATGRLHPLLHRLLDAERAVCLTQVRSVLEFSLWGPSDVTLGNSVRERELALQRWLDLQRATVLHGLVCTKVQLTVYEECHLLFLVRSSAKMLCDASLLLDSVTATAQLRPNVA